jgi:hypothetical protein
VSPHIECSDLPLALMDGLGLLAVVELEGVGEGEEDAAV